MHHKCISSAASVWDYNFLLKLPVGISGLLDNRSRDLLCPCCLTSIRTGINAFSIPRPGSGGMSPPQPLVRRLPSTVWGLLPIASRGGDRGENVSAVSTIVCGGSCSLQLKCRRRAAGIRSNTPWLDTRSIRSFISMSLSKLCSSNEYWSGIGAGSLWTMAWCSCKVLLASNGILSAQMQYSRHAVDHTSALQS